jgi:CheY-like chemotaxis protein
VAEQRILIVDSSEAFATMLKEGLESSGPYKAIIATSGTDALDVLVQNQIDLAIVDMGLEDMDGPALVHSLRQSKPDLRIMLIPLLGQELTRDEQALKVQGVLPKPFFIDDLPSLIQAVLPSPAGEKAVMAAVAPIEAPPKPHPERPPVPRPASREMFASHDVNELLQELFEEVRAEAVLFIQGSDLIAHAGNITRGRAQELGGLAVESMKIAHRIARFLGETDDCFEQCTLEGDEYSVYSMKVTSNTMLSVSLSARTPAGIVRYNLRRLADALADTWHE